MKKGWKAFYIIMLLIIGMALGYIVIQLVEYAAMADAANASYEMDFIAELLKVEFVIIGGLLFGFFFQIIVHESGHLIFGRLTGYKYVSFRIFSHIFINKNGKLTRKRFKIVGTAGQCLMDPPEMVNGTIPYILYNLGGCLMNFICSLICLILYFVLRDSAPWLAVWIMLTALIGIFSGLLNLIPIKGLANDGSNIIRIGKSLEARHAFWLQLRINAIMTAGGRCREIPEEWLVLPDHADLNNDTFCATAIYRFCFLYDNHEFEQAKEWAEKLLETVDRMLPIQRMELKCELLLLEIIGQCRKDVIDQLYTKELKIYIKKTKIYISRMVLMYAYTKLVSKDAAEAGNYYAAFKKAADTCPFAGEYEAQKEMIEIIDNTAAKWC